MFRQILKFILFICFLFFLTKPIFLIMRKMLLFAGALLLTQISWAQSLKPIAHRVFQEKQLNGDFPKASIFSDKVQDLSARRDLLDVCADGLLLTFDAAGLESLRSSNPDRVEMTIPVPGGNALQVEMVRGNVFSPGFKIRQASDPGINADVDAGIHYWGIVRDDPNTLVGISIFEHEVMGTISTSSAKYVLGALENDRNNTHIIYEESDLLIKNQAVCWAETLEEVGNGAAVADRSAGPDNCVNLYMEADYTIFQNKGSVADATAYVTGFFSQVSLLYANDEVNMVLNELLVWDVPDPYTGPSSSQYLTQFRNYLNGNYNGDLAHLVGFTGGGGIAYVDVLCNSFYGVGYSGINTTYSNVPTYSWTVEVVTHELGHNLGSSHTHACAWNGNNTAIDGCGPAAGYSEGCDAPLPPANGGTIMSYCHLIGAVGINFNLGFGPQPGDRIRSEVYNSPCLAPCGGGGGPCSYVTINSQNFDSGWGIWTDGGTDCARINNATYANSPTYSIRLRDNTNSSVMSTTNQNWTAYEEITVTFSYITTSFENNEDFWLQRSNNGGSSYSTVGDWNCNAQFTNGVRGTGTVVLPGPFVSNTRLRFRCDASADDDQVYIDDVVITGCLPAGFAPEDPSEDRIGGSVSDEIATIDGVRISPNPATDVLDIRYQISKDAAIQVILLDLTGRLIQQNTMNVSAGSQQFHIDLSGLPSGLYSVQLISSDQMYSEKVVVRK